MVENNDGSSGGPPLLQRSQSVPESNSGLAGQDVGGPISCPLLPVDDASRVDHSGPAAVNVFGGSTKLLLRQQCCQKWQLPHCSCHTFGSSCWRCHKDTVLADVKADGLALQFASKALQADREVVLAAVKQNGKALEFARLPWKGMIEDDLNRLRKAYRGVPVQDREKINLRHVERGTRSMLGWTLGG